MYAWTEAMKVRDLEPKGDAESLAKRKHGMNFNSTIKRTRKKIRQ